MKNRKNTAYTVFEYKYIKFILKVTRRCPLFSFFKMNFTYMNNDNFTSERFALGIRIHELRQRVINSSTNKSISQEELGLRANITKKTIGEIERGETNVKLETLLMISKGLNVTIKELFNFDMEKYKNMEI